MWSYIVRRLLLMIPTLFGVTIVSFIIMQLAPGDPNLTQFSSEGASAQTREAYLIQKRDLKLDKPLLLNFRYFYDYRDDVLHAAWVRSRTPQEIAAALPEMAAGKDPKMAALADFLERVFRENNTKIPWLARDKFTPQLMDDARHERLAVAIGFYVQAWCENAGQYAVQDTIDLLNSDETTLQQKIGLLDCLNLMVVEPHKYTYTGDPTDEQTPQVVAVWQLWWNRNEAKFRPLSPERRERLEENMKLLLATGSRSELFEKVAFLRDEYLWDYPDMRFFIERLLGDSPLREKAVSAMILKLYVPNPLQMTLPRDASEEQVEQAVANWDLHYELNKGTYNPGIGSRLWSIVADTQYAHMVWRLATFQFGRSALRTREPVSGKIWEAVQVSAPLMLMSSLLVYLVAVPLGIICSANHGRWLDTTIAIGLFLLYSIPAFVAAMLMLVFFAYGDFVEIFPMERLHGQGASQMDFGPYLLDYLWHATLPVVCLSLFGLAPLAMYARTSMLEILGQDFIRTARAKGLPERTVIFKHGLRNALIPIITLFASFLPALLGGSVLIEYIFNIPGMGRLSYESILLKDIPTVMALIYINAILVMVSILMTDLLYVVVDPRITFQGSSR